MDEAEEEHDSIQHPVQFHFRRFLVPGFHPLVHVFGWNILSPDKRWNSLFNSSESRVNRGSASGAANSALIPSRVKPMIVKLVFTASLLDAQH